MTDYDKVDWGKITDVLSDAIQQGIEKFTDAAGIFAEDELIDRIIKTIWGD